MLQRSTKSRKTRRFHQSRLAKLTAMAFAFGSLIASEPVWAAVPAKPAQQDPQVKSLVAAAVQAIRQGNFPLAIIQMKNALRLDPNNGTVRAQLGTVYLESGDVVSAERELRQARTNGAKPEDVTPGLLQAMLANKEAGDLLNQFPDPAPGDKSKLASVILRARALAYQSTGNGANATSAMDRSLAITRDANGLLTRAQIALFQSQPQVASSYIDQALAMSPGNVTGLMMRAAILRLGDKKASLGVLDTILKARPNYNPAKIAKLEVLLESGRNDDAQKIVDDLLTQSPDMPAALFYKAILLGMHKQAKEGWRIAQSLAPEFVQSDARMAIGTAELAAASGNMESGNAILAAYVSSHPNALEPRLRLAAMRMRMNNGAGALEVLMPVMNSADPRALEVIAAVYEQLHQQDKAVLYIRKAAAAGSKSVVVQYQVAVADIRQGDTQKGVQELIDLVKQMPNNLTAPGAGIELLISRGKFAEAQTVIDQAEKVNPKSPIPPYFEGELHIAQRKLDNSLADFGTSLTRDANYLPALYARAAVYIAQKKYQDAMNDIQRAQARQPNNPLFYAKLGEIAALMGKPGQAVDLLKSAIAKAPNSVDMRLVLARYQIYIKQNAEALKTVQDALKVAPNNAQALALLGDIQQRLGQKTAAIDTNKKLTQKYQMSGAAQFLLANSLNANGDKKGAIAALKKATELSPDVVQYRAALIGLQIEQHDGDGAVATAQSWAALHKGADGAVLTADTLIRLKRLPEAAALVQKALADQPDSRLIMLDAQIALARKDVKRALSVLKNWLSDHSTDMVVRQGYASALMSDTQNAAALAQYEIILKTRGDIPEVLNNTAWLIKDSDPTRALTLAAKGWQVAPNMAEVGDTYGWLLLRKGDANAALPVLQRAHAIGPGNDEISYHLALALNASGKKADAKSLLKATLAKGTNFNGVADAKKLLQTL